MWMYVRVWWVIVILCLYTQLRNAKQLAVTAATPEKMPAVGTYIFVCEIVCIISTYSYAYHINYLHNCKSD